MRYVDLTGSREAADHSIRRHDMPRRLPQLVHRSLALTWHVGRRSPAGLLLCQAVSGVMQAALGLHHAHAALLRDADIYHRLLQVWPSVALITGVAGVCALLGITVNWLPSRLVR